jgi:hypothetical protein
MGKENEGKTPPETGKSAVMAMRSLKGDNSAMTAWVEFMTESARFATDRFKQDLETQQAMLKCKKPEDLFCLQSDFFLKAMEQYTSGATRMAQLMSKTTTQTMTGVKNVQARGYDDVPL